MWSSRQVLLLTLLLLGPGASASAEVLIRWNLDQVPARDSLGISTLVMPAANTAAVHDALRKGYRVLLETDSSGVAALKLPASAVDGVVVRGTLTDPQVLRLRQRLSPAARVFGTNTGRWPHVRLNWVTLREDVLQVASRTAQPWIENNGARLYLERLRAGQPPRLLTYAWQPITVSDMHQGPALENYLVAIAEAGTFGGDLLLPLHERFQRSLVLGHPAARKDWEHIRRALAFYSWELPARHQRVSNIGVVTGKADAAFLVLNLLLRHNLPFEVIKPSDLPVRKLESLAVLVMIDQPAADQLKVLERFASAGGTVVMPGLKGPFPWHAGAPAVKTDEQTTYRVGKGLVLEYAEPISDPNVFALDVRQALTRPQRVLEIWNGTTVIASPYEDAATGTLLITLLNYAHESTPVQLRVRGTYSVVQYETPDAPAVLIPYRHDNGQTEFVLPDLRVGGRIFLSRDDRSN